MNRKHFSDSVIRRECQIRAFGWGNRRRAVTAEMDLGYSLLTDGD